MAGRRRRRHIELETAQQKRLEYAEDFDTLLHLFLRDCRIRNLSDKTLIFYRQELTKFRNILERQDLDTTPAKITDKHIKENLILRMMDDNAAEATINATLRAVRTFFNFLERESYVLQNPMETVKLVKEKKTILQTFNRDQLRAILRQPDLRTFVGQRDYTVMLLMVETGVRVKELVGITVQDVLFKDNQIRIQDAKGYKERFVPIQAVMKRQLAKFITIRGELDTDILFISVDNMPLSIRQVQERVKHYGKLAGIQGVRCSPHTFRHTFARMAVENGADAFSLRAIMGHTTFEMTNRYVNLFGSSVRDMHKKYSPVESIGHLIDV